MDTTNLATKKDIQELKIKDINPLKQDVKVLKQDVKSIRQDLLKLEEKIDAVEERLEAKIDAVEERLSIKLDKIMNTLDGFVSVVDDLRTDNTVGAHHTRELKIKVDGHEKRLKKIEASVKNI